MRPDSKRKRRPYLSMALYFDDHPGQLVFFRQGGRMLAGRFVERIKVQPEDILVVTDRKGQNPTRVLQTHVYKYPRAGQTETR